MFVYVPQVGCREQDSFTYRVINLLGNVSPPSTVTLQMDCSSFHISAINFADTNLGACVNEQAQQNDWVLSTDITELSCNNKGIQNASGIEKLINLN